MSCELYKYCWSMSFHNYVVYRDVVDDKSVPEELRAQSHAQAYFVQVEDAKNYCEYRNYFTEKVNDDDIRKINWIEVETKLNHYDLLAEQFERAKAYTGFEGWACPLCVYKDGKLIRRCEMHGQIFSLSNELRFLQDQARWIIKALREAPKPLNAPRVEWLDWLAQAQQLIMEYGEWWENALQPALGKAVQPKQDTEEQLPDMQVERHQLDQYMETLAKVGDEPQEVTVPAQQKRERALKDSIRHWVRLLEYTVLRDGEALKEEGMTSTSCALCALYFDEKECEGCPVSQATGREGCSDTPYGQAYDAVRAVINDERDEKGNQRRVLRVLKEVKFLVSLL